VEGDFAQYFHFHALDYVHGLRPWSEFLRYVDRLGTIQGSAVWANKLADPGMIDRLEADMKAGKVDTANARPELFGFSQTASGFLMVANQLIALRAESAHNEKLQTIKGPVFPLEIVESRLREFAKIKRSNAIEESQARNRKKRGLVNA